MVEEEVAVLMVLMVEVVVAVVLVYEKTDLWAF